MATMLQIYLTRHGQTQWNAEDRLQGSTDVPLNETGHAQAAGLATRLAEVRLDHIYTSALLRTRQTAAPLAARAPITALAELNEHGLGKFEGRRASETELVEELVRRLGDPQDDLDGGESADQHYARVTRAVERIRGAHASGTVLVIAHGGTNRQLLRAFLGLSREEVRRYHQAHTELYLLELDGAETRLVLDLPTVNLDVS